MPLLKILQQPAHELLLVEIGEIFELLSSADKSRWYSEFVLDRDDYSSPA